MRVDNVGSMLRPPALLKAFERAASGVLDANEFRAVQDRAIEDLVGEQVRRGLPVIVDGEFRRRQFMESFSIVAGFSDWSRRHAAVRAERRLDAAGGSRTEAPSAKALTPATRRLELVRNVPLVEYAFTAQLTERPVKVTLIGPDRVFQAWDADASRTAYATDDAFLDDVVRVERDIVAGLAAAGCPYVHMDAPGFTAYVDEPSLARMRERGRDPDVVLEATIAAENAVIAGHDGVTFGVHLCRGNDRSHWHREGAYDAIAERLFSELRHDRFLLEYDTERAGSFAALRFVPPGPTVVLGLITTKSGEMEVRDELLRRIDEATTYIPVDQLAISPQCGFASLIEGNSLTIDAQWRKLELMLDIADEVWGSSAPER